MTDPMTDALHRLTRAYPIALMAYLGIFDSQIIAQNVINGVDSFPLMAVPFFILAGEVMNTGGLARRTGIDPVYFGVLFIINNAIGLITPPVGAVLNVVCGVSKVSMDDLMRGVWPFMIAQLVVLLLLTLFPVLVTGPAKWFGG